MTYTSHTKKGFAILFTLIIISIISLISFGISNMALKEIILSSVATDSQIAFYQADTAAECGLYAESSGKIEEAISAGVSGATFSCGLDPRGGGNLPFKVQSLLQNTMFTVTSTLSQVNLAPCFKMGFTKIIPTVSTDPVITTMTAQGFNICDTSNIRAVQRTLQVKY